ETCPFTKTRIVSTDWRLFPDETCVVVRMALSGCRIVASLPTRRRHRRLRLSQQPQGRRLPLSPWSTRRSVVPIKGRDVEAARDAELSDHAEAVIANQLTPPSVFDSPLVRKRLGLLQLIRNSYTPFLRH